MKYSIFLFILLISCHDQERDRCNLIRTRSIDILNGVASIAVPEMMAVVEDTVNYDFERSANLRFNRSFYSADSTSSLNVQIVKNVLSDQSFVNYSAGIKEYAKANFYSNGSDLQELWDTSGAVKKYQLSIKEDKQKENRSFGYIVFYKESLQGTIIFKIANKDSIEADYLDCVMKSFSIN